MAGESTLHYFVQVTRTTDGSYHKFENSYFMGSSMNSNSSLIQNLTSMDVLRNLKYFAKITRMSPTKTATEFMTAI